MSILTHAGVLKALDASIGWTLCKLLGRLRHAARRPTLASTPSPDTVRRILVVRPGGIGDMLMLLPVLRSLNDALPGVEIDIVCEQRNHDVLKLAGSAHNALLYDAHPFALLCHLQRTAYDIVVDTEQFHNFSAILALMSGAPVRAGFKINPARLHLYTHLVDYDVDGYEADQFVRLFRSLGVTIPSCRLPDSLSDAKLPRDGTPPPRTPRGGRVIAIGPGASDPYKEWGEDKYAAFSESLLDSGHSIVLVGGAADRPAAGRILARLTDQRAVSDTTGTCSLGTTAAILKQADLYVGCDSGLAHLATALGTKSLVLFGPSDPRKWAAPDERHIVLRKDLPCSPCAIFGYRKWCRGVPCMRTISAEEAVTAVQPLLA